MNNRFTTVIEREGDGYVALCPELDIASQGVTVEAARANLREALALFFETASPAEIAERFHNNEAQVSGAEHRRLAEAARDFTLTQSF